MNKSPMTAYDLLEQLKPHGIKAPPVVYRALDSLLKDGLVHKIKEISAFVACDCTKDHKHALSVLAVCSGCHSVEELHGHKVIHQLEKLQDYGVRLAQNAVIELPIICNSCISSHL